MVVSPSLNITPGAARPFLRRLAKGLVRTGIAPVLDGVGVVAALRAVRRFLVRDGRLLVLVYHRICDPDPARFRHLSETLGVAPARFADQMAYLAQHYEVLPLELALARLDDGGLRRDAVAITFDDGYRDNLTVALPTLARHGLPATIFLATDHVGNGSLPWYDRIAPLLDRLDLAAFRQSASGTIPLALDQLIGDYVAAVGPSRGTLVNAISEALKLVADIEKERILAALSASSRFLAVDERAPLMLDWEEVRQMTGSGITFGSHTCSHPILSRVQPDRLEAEMAGSKAAVEAATGVPCRLFAFPNGRSLDCPPDAAALLARHGYAAAFATSSGVNGPSTDRMALNRVAIGNYPRALFAAFLEYWLLARRRRWAPL